VKVRFDDDDPNLAMQEALRMYETTIRALEMSSLGNEADLNPPS
jgi:hypothetical protein